MNIKFWSFVESLDTSLWLCNCSVCAPDLSGLDLEQRKKALMWLTKLKQSEHMKIEMMCIDKMTETFPTKNGIKTTHLLVLNDPSRPPLRQTIDYILTDEENSDIGRTLVDKMVKISVSSISSTFAGRIRVSGSILKA